MDIYFSPRLGEKLREIEQPLVQLAKPWRQDRNLGSDGLPFQA